MEGFLPLYDISVTNALLYLHQKNKKPQGRKRKGESIMKNNKLIDNKTLLRTCGFILGTYAIATIAIAANKIINYDKQ